MKVKHELYEVKHVDMRICRTLARNVGVAKNGTTLFTSQYESIKKLTDLIRGGKRVIT